MKLYFVSSDCPARDSCLRIDDREWGLVSRDLEPDAPQPPQFICVSYSWGLGRSTTPFDPSFQVSDRTLPALTTAIQQRPSCRNVWIDAICVPPTSQPEARAATLESMGFIYSRAAEVIVVLSERALPVIQQAVRKAEFSASHLEILESEDWVTRAWTYQEAVNANRLCITCSGAPPGTAVDFMPFFSGLGHSLVALTPVIRQLYPRLNAFEDLMCDCAVAAYLNRSALQVMSIMDERTQTRPEDHFYAMIGAVSTEPAQTTEGLGACEAFMTICERKGDYSFIFSSEARDSRPGKRWRPNGDGELRALIRLPIWGDGLTGRVTDKGMTLENVIVLHVAVPGPHVIPFIKRWLFGFKPDVFGSLESQKEIEEAAWLVLRELGFTGSPEYVTTRFGLFFPQRRIPSASNTEILVAADLRWSLGCPGLARYCPIAGSSEFLYEPGVFFGECTAIDQGVVAALLS